MKRMFVQIILGLLSIVCVILVLFYLASFIFSFKTFPKPAYGVTFSTVYAKELGIDWQEAFEASLADLNQQNYRIPLYWSSIESERGVYDFSEIDWMMDRAAEYDARVTLVVGLKVPRWPECFIPEWAEELSPEEREAALFGYMQTAVERYKAHPALERWQVENEPFFPFGECPPPNAERYYREIELVRGLDSSHPIQGTVSGEQSIWAGRVKPLDVIGASLYRTVYVPVLGHTTFPIPPFWYAVQGALANQFGARPIISELQLEPWFPPASELLTLEAKYQLFTEKEFARNVRFAQATGIDEVYVWGIEWWYFLKQNDRPQLWDTARELLQAE